MTMSATQVVLAVLETFLIVYGIVESKLFTQVRIVFEAWMLHANVWLFQGFLHCPFCVGFWVALLVGIANGAPFGLELLAVPSLYIALLLIKRDLIRPSEHEIELAQSIARSAQTKAP